MVREVRALVTIQGPNYKHAPGDLFEAEEKEVERLRGLKAIEVYEGQEYDKNALKHIDQEAIQPPPAMPEGIEDEEAGGVIFKDDPGDVAGKSKAPNRPAVQAPKPPEIKQPDATKKPEDSEEKPKKGKKK